MSAERRRDVGRRTAPVADEIPRNAAQSSRSRGDPLAHRSTVTAVQITL
jgi:hypothetical protein